MKTALFGVIGFIVLLIGVVVTSYISNYNYGNRIEKQIEAEYENTQNILSQYSNKIAEIAQVPGMARDDLKEVYTEVMGGRYGDNGSKAMMQWITEQNPQLDASLYTNIQQAMEAGRTKFENAQTKLIDHKRQYETNLGYLWKGTWLRIAGYPKLDLDEIKIIKSDYSNEAYESGVENGIQLRKEQ
jgi:hypothetical protein